MREKAEAEVSKEIPCISGGPAKQACLELQFILESTGHTLGRQVEMNLSSRTSEEETPNLDLQTVLTLNEAILEILVKALLEGCKQGTS